MRVCIMVLLAGVLSGPAVAGDEPEYEMTTYQFVLLHTGQNDTPLSEAESHDRQVQHLEFLQKLIDEEQAVIVGPVEDGERLRGIVVLDVGSVERAETVLSRDPWISIGKLEPEIHVWWTARDVLQKPADIMDHRAAWLGLLRRPEGAPDLAPEKLQELQAGHRENIKKMADSGDLVLAGPMGDDGMLRGIFIFRTESEERVRRLVAQDPAVQAGRLEIDLYAWTIPRESFPEP